MIKKTNNHRDVTLTRYHPSCRLCHYAGFSNICTFSQTDVCPYDWKQVEKDNSVKIKAEQDDQ